MSSVLASYLLFYLFEPASGITHLMDFGCLVKSNNPFNVLGRYIVRFLNNTGPVLTGVPESTYYTALYAPCGVWHLQKDGRIRQASRRPRRLTAPRFTPSFRHFITRRWHICDQDHYIYLRQRLLHLRPRPLDLLPRQR